MVFAFLSQSFREVHESAPWIILGSQNYCYTKHLWQKAPGALNWSISTATERSFAIWEWSRKIGISLGKLHTSIRLMIDWMFNQGKKVKK